MNTFGVPNSCALESADAYMKSCEARVKKLEGDSSVKAENMSVSSESLARTYPLFASSLFSLIKNCEDSMENNIYILPWIKGNLNPNNVKNLKRAVFLYRPFSVKGDFKDA